MTYLYFVAGSLVFIVTAAEIIKTVFSTRGGGAITTKLTKAIWALFFFTSREKGDARLLEYAGPSILIVVLICWIVGVWLGLFLMLMADQSSIVSSTTQIATTPLEKLYYAGFTLSTLGVGDYKATNDFWRISTSIASFTGLVFITSAITYFVQVLSAVSLQSKLSLYVNAMGKTPQEIIANGHNGSDFEQLAPQFLTISEMLFEHSINHQSFPVIHYFHASDPGQTVIPAIVRIGEASGILVHGSVKSNNLQLPLKMLRTSLDTYVGMVKGGLGDEPAKAEKPPTPNLSMLRERGIALEQDGTTYFEQPQLAQRRRLFSTLLHRDGWSWRQVYGEETDFT
ncbi:potassium channel family protein [Pseudomonas sp. PS1]|uniref:Potassium channel family protein n=1 Tax=Stutzerimonas marianensis TaxID=2929513 RepID=A0A9X1W9L1_9GAMM|nr:potassium channel family protein [Pseudomonas marianensis]